MTQCQAALLHGGSAGVLLQQGGDRGQDLL